ncbi:MAG: hypothetical protein ACE5IM_02565 [Nitrospinota bacterium]
MWRRRSRRRFGKTLFLVCVLYLLLVLYLAAYGIPVFFTPYFF